MSWSAVSIYLIYSRRWHTSGAAAGVEMSLHLLVTGKSPDIPEGGADISTTC